MLPWRKLFVDVILALALFHVILFVVPELLLIERGGEQHVRMTSGASIVQRIEQFAVMAVLTALFWKFVR